MMETMTVPASRPPTRPSRRDSILSFNSIAPSSSTFSLKKKSRRWSQLSQTFSVRSSSSSTSSNLTPLTPKDYVPVGHMGALTQSQEAKLRALWAIGAKFVEVCGDKDRQHTHLKTMEEKYVPPAKQARNVGKHKITISHTADKYPNLVAELLSIMPREEKNHKKLAARAVEALDYWTPDMYHLLVEHAVRHEHPDTLALRFLRACNWDIIDATVMLGKSMYWRTMEYVVEDDIMKNGEGGAAHDEKNAQGNARHLAADFMAQLRMGKAFVFGEDRVGRPVVHVRVRTHHASDQSAEALKRFTVYMFEQARLALKHPVEKGVSCIPFHKSPLLYISPFFTRSSSILDLFLAEYAC